MCNCWFWGGKRSESDFIYNIMGDFYQYLAHTTILEMNHKFCPKYIYGNFRVCFTFTSNSVHFALFYSIQPHIYAKLQGNST